MPNTERVPILETRLELTRYLTADERAEIAGVSLPVITHDPGPLDMPALLTGHAAFGAIVLDGMVMASLRIGEQTGTQLLGPGDLIVPRDNVLPGWLMGYDVQAAGPVRMALFGRELLATVQRWPLVCQGIYGGYAERLQRLTAQLVICQLPRVDDRVLAMLWLLSETWGQVTPSGVRLPLALTHETIGALIGARRPTVTLALRKLTQEGSIVHQGSGWLLLKPPPERSAPPTKILPPEIAGTGDLSWAPGPVEQDPSLAYAELRDTVRRLREQHRHDQEQTYSRLERVRTTRVRVSALRKRIVDDALRRQPPPSS